MRTAVIYARYSSDSQTEQSIEGQIRECKRFAEYNDIIIVDTYIDRAMTGTNDNRAAFQKMLKDSTKKQWQIVLVYKLDRFSRNKYEAVVHKKTLRDNGVRIVSAMENLPDTPEGILMESILEGFNQYYSEELKQKVNRGLRESWIKGNATSSKHIYGYDIENKKYIVNQREADVVKEVFDRYSKGEVVPPILKSLNERGIFRADGKRFSENGIYSMLHNIRYTGIVEHQGVVYDNIFPRIISNEVWLKVCSIYEENKISPSRKKDIFDYILSTKLVCGLCKRKMHGVSGTSRNGESHGYYVCKHKREKQPCQCKGIQKQYIEDLVVNKTTELLAGTGNIRKISESILKIHQKETADNTTLNLLQTNRDEAYKASKNIVKAIEQGIITEMTKDRLTELESEMSRLDFEIAKEKQRNYAFLTLEQIQFYINKHLFENTEDMKTRKLLVNTFIREIIVFPEKVIITYNFIEPSEPIKIDADSTEDVLRQSQQTAFELNTCSCKFVQSPPHNDRSNFFVSNKKIRPVFSLPENF